MKAISLACPHCGGLFSIYFQISAINNDAERKRAEEELRNQWKKAYRAEKSMEQNTAWLEGRKDILKKIGWSIDEALTILGSGDNDNDNRDQSA